MFGRMTTTPLVRLDAGKNLDVAVAELLAATEYPQIARWIQFPTAVAKKCGRFGYKSRMTLASEGDEV
jgi:hypothetical protein